MNLVGEVVTYNYTTRTDETSDSYGTTLAVINFGLSNGQDRTDRLTSIIPSVGLWTAQFLLFKDGAPTGVGRELHTYVDAT